MKNKIYPFLLGLSCIVIVALVSFKNSEKAVEKEYMTILIDNTSPLSRKMYISTSTNYEEIQITPKGQLLNYTFLLAKIQEYEKEGWMVYNSDQNYYLLEREKKQ